MLEYTLKKVLFKDSFTEQSNLVCYGLDYSIIHSDLVEQGVLPRPLFNFIIGDFGSRVIGVESSSIQHSSLFTALNERKCKISIDVNVDVAEN